MTSIPDFIPFFIKGSAGNLFAIYHPPKLANKAPRNILYIPPFSEESNRCRSMMSLQARELANNGIGVLAVDLFGTGDSGGNFVDGCWDQWISDVIRATEWLHNEYGYICDTLWGVRLSTMLATDVALKLESINNLIFWQPVLNGKNYMTQFLRIRVAAEFNENSGVKGTKELRQQFEEGKSVEVSGYEISSKLANSIDSINPSKLSKLNNINIDWFEVITSEAFNIPRSTVKVMEDCKNTSTTIRLHQVKGAAFWQLHERTMAPKLISETTKIFLGR